MTAGCGGALWAGAALGFAAGDAANESSPGLSRGVNGAAKRGGSSRRGISDAVQSPSENRRLGPASG